MLSASLEAHVAASDNSALAKDCRRDIKAANTALLKLSRKVPMLISFPLMPAAGANDADQITQCFSLHRHEPSTLWGLPILQGMPSYSPTPSLQCTQGECTCLWPTRSLQLTQTFAAGLYREAGASG